MLPASKEKGPEYRRLRSRLISVHYFENSVRAGSNDATED